MRIESKSFEVSPALQPFVESYWFCRNDHEGEAWSSLQSCVPTGCIEMIFQVSEKGGIGLIKDVWKPFPEAYVVGVKRDPVYWRLPAGGAYFGISLKPDGFLQLFNDPLAEARYDRLVTFHDFFGTRLDHFAERVRGAKSNHERIAIVESIFTDLLRKNDNHHPYLIDALRQIRHSLGTSSIENISHQVFVGQRQLQRVFREVVGISPKLYGRIVRFNKAYQFAKNHPETSLAQITRRFGYTDQSHFIREFREFAGASPSSFLNTYAPLEQSPFAFACGCK